MSSTGLVGVGLLLAAAAGGLVGCSDYRGSGGAAAVVASREAEAARTVASFRDADSTFKKFFDSAHAWAVFPDIGKGGFVLGAANGDGVVYRNTGGVPGTVVGYSTMTQVSLGAQVGGQSYAQIIFFQDAAAFARFRENRTDFLATASAVIVTSGAAAANDYNQGVAVFVRPLAGGMVEAALGGQKYEYRPR